MKPGTVRLQAFSEITRRPREAIRNAQKFGQTPWDDTKFENDSQRRYDGFHALAAVLAEGLMAQNCSMQLAGEFVRGHEKAISLFLEEVTENRPITPRFVLAMQRGTECSLLGPAFEPVFLVGYGTAEEVSDAITGEISRVGTVNKTRDGRSEKRIVSGPWSAIVSIPEAYRLLRQRAEAAGYVVDGRRIFKIAEEAEADSEG